MNRLLKLLAVPIAAIILLQASPVSAFDILGPVCNNASPSQSGQPAICGDNQSTSTTDPIYGSHGILASIINILSFIGGFFAVIFIIVAGIRLTLSSGDSKNVADARTAIIYSLAGLAIIALAQVVVRFILERVPK